MIPFDLKDVVRVTFYKRDELTTDLICVDVEVTNSDGVVAWTMNEEAPDWDAWINHLSVLPAFNQDWYEAVVHPPFAPCPTVAFERRSVS